MSAPTSVNEMRLNPVDGWWRRLGFLLLPPRCLLCGERGTSGRELCARCHSGLPWNAMHCARCALPLTQPAAFCAHCLRHTPSFDRVLAPLQYASPLDTLIMRFKFKEDLAAGNLLADLVIDAIRTSTMPLPDLIIPVPLHERRLRERGFNQSLELARRIGKAFARQVDGATLRRMRATEVQSVLAAKARRQNVRGAFASAPGRIDGRSIALVDDVVTTAATVNECATILKRAGAREVNVWAVARAPERS